VKAPKVTAHQTPINERPLLNGLDAIFLLILGFSIQPFVASIAHRDVFRIIVGVAIFVIVYRRIIPRLEYSSQRRRRMSSFTIDFTQEAAENVERLAAKKGLTRGELVRRSLALYDAVVEEAGSNGRVIVRTEHGERELVGI